MPYWEEAHRRDRILHGMKFCCRWFQRKRLLQWTNLFILHVYKISWMKAFPAEQRVQVKFLIPEESFFLLTYLQL